MTQELMQTVYQWFVDNEDNYRQECEEGFESYMVEDAISKFTSWEDKDEDDRWEIGSICSKAMRGAPLED